MKLLIGLLLLAFSSAAIACPNLNATYSCGDGTDNEDMTISTQVVNGVYHYTVDGEVAIADGVERVIEGGKYTFTCSANTLSMKALSVMEPTDSEQFCSSAAPAQMQTDAMWTDNGSTMPYSVSAVIRCADGTQFPFQGTGMCTRK